MAHELEILANGQASMFYAGEVPWHGLGVGVQEAKSSAEAAQLAHIDWDVALGPLYGPKTEGHANRVEGRFSIYRSTDKKVLGIVSNRYQPLQNREAFDFLDSLLQDGVLKYETAGSLSGGRRIFLLARLEEGMRVGSEEYKNYLLLTTQHDGWGKVRVLPTTVRVVCNNTLQMALPGGGGIAIVHNSKMQTKLEQAKEVLRISTESSRRMAEWLRRMQDAKVNTDDIEAVRTVVVGTYDENSGALRRKAVETFQAIYEAERVVAGADTAYALANTVTGVLDHTKKYLGDSNKRAENRFAALTLGPSAAKKADALELIGKLAGTPPPVFN